MSRGGDPTLGGKVRQPCADLWRTHLGGVALAVKEDEIADPRDICLFGADTVVARAQQEANPVEELRHGERVSERCQGGSGIPMWVERVIQQSS